MTAASEETVRALVALGFTGLEAEVYVALVGESPSTGYRIAQSLGKPVANTYKAIESLAAKGAVLVDDGTSRLCRAIPPEELLGRLERAFAERRANAAEALARLRTAPADDDRVYQMRSAEQVLERARQMLAAAREVVLVDAFPRPLEALAADLEAAAARGVTVAVKAYEPVEIAGVDVFVGPTAAEVLAVWPGQWVNLVADGHDLLLGLLGTDMREVFQAVWSASAYLSWVYHGGVASEIILTAVQSGLHDDAEIDRLWRAYMARTRGPRSLIARFGETQNRPR